MMSAEGFAEALADLGPQAGTGDEWYPAEWTRSLECVAATQPCRRAWFVTKPQWLASISAGGDLPADAVVFARSCLPLTTHVRWIRRALTDAAVPLGFVGDLDPWDLTVWLALRAGGVAGGGATEPGLELGWLGVDDAWLALCEANVATSDARLPTIALTSFERVHLAWLERLGVDWERVIGPRATALLRSGHKLELEGASNSALYTPGFAAMLADHLATLGARG